MNKRKPTIHEIAKELNISAATVSRALNDDSSRISDETRKKVREMADKLGYQPNVVAASLRKGHSNIIGIVVPFADRFFFSSVIRGVEEEVKKEGYSVIICQSYEKLENEREDINTLLSAQVAGILISPSRETTEIDHLLKVIKLGKTLVMFDRTIAKIPASSVSVDDFQGAYDMVTHLARSGRDRIAYYTGNQRVSVFKERERGYETALQDNNLKSYEDYLVTVDGFRVDGASAAEKLMSLESPPDAIFSSSDFSALGAMQWLLKNGYKVPGDVSVAGFGNDQFTDFLTPTMSSVDQKSFEMGKASARLFLEELTNQTGEYKKIILSPELIIRDSTSLEKI